jgi:hypothetical protein
MSRCIAASVLVFAMSSCAGSDTASPRDWHFAVEGRLASVSAADIADVVAAMDEEKIYRVRVINHNTVEVDTKPERFTIVPLHGAPPEVHSVSYTVVRRVHGVWKADEHVIHTF